MLMKPAGRTAIISALGGLGIGLIISGWHGTPSIAQEAPTQGVHTHDESEDHSHVHAKQSWLTVEQLAKNVRDHIDVIKGNTEAVAGLGDKIETLEKQCKSFEDWKKEQKETNVRLEADNAGTLAKVGGSRCPGDEASCIARNLPTLDERASDLEERLAQLEETIDNPEWVAKMDTLGTRIKACDSAFLRADDHIDALRQTRDALERAYKPKLLSVSSYEAENLVVLTVHFEIGVGADGEPLCDQYLVIASLENRSGPAWSNDTATARSTGQDVECEAKVRINGKLADFDPNAEVIIFSKKARHEWSL